ncbi:cation diffusion facilitator family transporter [Saccharicrinis sp. FJH54]|uniref:cation diffusion facilitator family transporter n=1 Tax=Saccharicrinis sp. FJH54 TaxID=3344665 RepID=UPI0035D4F249
MAHQHTHSHTQASEKSYGKAFAIGIGLNIAFVVLEVIYGLIANSSALLADAGHNTSDVLSLIFAWAAARLATMKPKGKYTYGLRKTTILVSILNALLLFVAVGLIAWDAIRKFSNPEPVGGTEVMIVAGVGVVINTITALLFMKGQKDDLNIKGAFLHMAADAGVSMGVVIAGLLINLTGKLWIDPVTSCVIIVVILWGTWKLFTDSIDLALDAVPKHIHLEKVRDFLLNKDGVSDVHDLHIWAMSTTQIALTVHLIMPEGYEDNFISELQHDLSHEFGIGHTTFQIENSRLQSECRNDC